MEANYTGKADKRPLIVYATEEYPHYTIRIYYESDRPRKIYLELYEPGMFGGLVIGKGEQEVPPARGLVLVEIFSIFPGPELPSADWFELAAWYDDIE